MQVEQVFLEACVPATVLRAAMVIGSGSISFEILRRLTERVPATPIPAWMRRRWRRGGDLPRAAHCDGEVAGVRRRQLILPWVPRLLVGWIVAWVTGMPRATVTSLVESLGHDMVCGEDDVRRELADAAHRFVPLREALERSLDDGPEGASFAGDVQAAAATDPS